MNCKKCKSFIPLYIDGIIDGKMMDKISSHLKNCNSCAHEYHEYLDMRNMCSDLPQLEVPNNFQHDLHNNLIKEGRRIFKKPYIKIATGIAAVVAILFLGTALLEGINAGSKSNKSYDSADKSMKGEGYRGDTANDDSRADADFGGTESPSAAPSDMESPKEDMAMENDIVTTEKNSAAGNSSAQTVPEVDRKIIKSAYLGVETMNFDETVDALIAKLNMMQGYVETSEIQGTSKYSGSASTQRRKAHFEMRIPKKSFDSFISSISELANITNKQIMGEDITSQYFDTEARLKSLTIQEERLITILSKAEKLQDIIELERELSRIRYEIENYTGTLKKWDNMVDYSRISIDLYEVKELKKEIEDTFYDRIKRSFKNSLKNLRRIFEDTTIFIISSAPYLLILAIILFLVKVVFFKNRSIKNQLTKGDKKDEEEDNL